MVRSENAVGSNTNKQLVGARDINNPYQHRVIGGTIVLSTSASRGNGATYAESTAPLQEIPRKDNLCQDGLNCNKIEKNITIDLSHSITSVSQSSCHSSASSDTPRVDNVSSIDFENSYSWAAPMSQIPQIPGHGSNRAFNLLKENCAPNDRANVNNPARIPSSNESDTSSVFQKLSSDRTVNENMPKLDKLFSHDAQIVDATETRNIIRVSPNEDTVDKSLEASNYENLFIVSVDESDESTHIAVNPINSIEKEETDSHKLTKLHRD